MGLPEQCRTADFRGGIFIKERFIGSIVVFEFDLPLRFAKQFLALVFEGG